MLLSSMKDNTIAKKASLEFYSSFNGSMHIGVKSKKAAISEIYIGIFNVTQRIKKTNYPAER